MQQRNYNYDYAKLNNRRGLAPVQTNPRVVCRPQKTTKVVMKPKKVKKKQNFLQKLVILFFASLFVVFVAPYTFKNTTYSMFIAPYFTKNITTDYNRMLNETTHILSNDYFLGERFLSKVETKKPQMQAPYISSEIIDLSKTLKVIAKKYPQIEPTVMVWDFETGAWAGINPDKSFSAASIIKIPVLIELFKSIENNEMKIYDTMALTDYFRAEGSGGLQYQRTGNEYSLDYLARTMIENSDNSSTNMLIAKLGSMVDMNRVIRKWGLKNTRINNWLPDMAGTNTTTARDLVTMLYNLDTPSFLSLKSRDRIFDYMGNVKNDRLLKAGLPANASIIHKTGDIGKTLGDAGIVHTHTGRRYIIAVMANRPYNSPAGKNYIIETSSVVYDYMVNWMK